jgi:hypothetical protein
MTVGVGVGRGVHDDGVGMNFILMPRIDVAAVGSNPPTGEVMKCLVLRMVEVTLQSSVTKHFGYIEVGGGSEVWG